MFGTAITKDPLFFIELYIALIDDSRSVYAQVRATSLAYLPGFQRFDNYAALVHLISL